MPDTTGETLSHSGVVCRGCGVAARRESTASDAQSPDPAVEPGVDEDVDEDVDDGADDDAEDPAESELDDELPEDALPDDELESVL